MRSFIYLFRCLSVARGDPEVIHLEDTEGGKGSIFNLLKDSLWALWLYFEIQKGGNARYDESMETDR